MKLTFVFGLVLCYLSGVALINMAEICDNGVDDDGDGFIDLNDILDCTCTGTDTIPFTSLIPNSSFEQIHQCPYTYAQLNFVQDWIQASDATSDYYNLCNFAGDGNLGLYGDPPLPLPHGNGYVGFSNATSGIYKEYVGACLNGPLKIDSIYTLQFYLGFGANGRLKPFSPFEVNVFGSTFCSSLPFQGETCPLGLSDWRILGTTIVSGANSWELVTFDFVPDDDVNAIVLGPGCTSHHESYYWLDRISLNRTVSFNGCPAFFIESKNCGAVELQSDHVDLSCEVQWYHNGVAIPGATDRTYLIDRNADGEYQLRLMSNGICNLSQKYFYTLQEDFILMEIDTLVCAGFAITVGDTIFAGSGQHEYRVRSDNGCDSLYRINITELPLKSLIIDTLICSGDSVIIDQVLYYDKGIYQILPKYDNNCTSVTLNLDVSDVVKSKITSVSICKGMEYSIGGERLSEEGQYEIIIQGKNDGCDTLVELSLRFVDIFPELIIQKTENEIGRYILTLENLPQDSVVSLLWMGPGLIDCDTCRVITVVPNVGSNTYQVIVSGINGCTSDSQISIDISEDNLFFIPSAFTPNNDNINDYFSFFTKESISLDGEFFIVNRWGDIVYKEQFSANHTELIGWDGRFNGSTQPAGVYSYVIKISDADINRKVFYGDFTLIR